jgi:uncharacterized protein YmfQ (DUF2313 family)
MLAPLLSDADFAAQFQSLMPTGEVWPRDADSVQAQTVRALVPTTTRQAAAAAFLLTDAFPAAALDLLVEWEETLGLPDPCAGPLPTIEERRAQVVARLTSRGGQSVAYFVAFAASLGYPITITQFAPFRAGMPVGMALNGTDWAFAWQVNAPTFTVEYFETGVSECGEPLAWWANTVLQCELQRLKPAHTTLLFSYS